MFVAGAALSYWAASQSRRAGRTPQFYQGEFAPAAVWACGAGFHNIDVRTQPGLAAFLQRGAEAFSCDGLAAAAPAPFDAFQRISVYLEYLVAWTWRLSGRTWHALDVLAAIFGGCLASALFGLMRLTLGRAASAIASLAALTSPLQLTFAPDLRDYSKAPFMIALILAACAVVVRDWSSRRLCGVMAVTGLVAGIGLGFRTDIVLMFVPIVIAVALCRRVTIDWRRHLVVSLAALLVFAGGFVASGWPVLRGYSSGGNTAHVALLGFAPSFDEGLGIRRSHYDVLPMYLDNYEEALVRDFARRTAGSSQPFAIGSDAYDRQSSRYLRSVVATYPADVIARAVAAAAKIVTLPFSDRASRVPDWITTSHAAGAFAVRARIATFARPLGIAAVAAIAVALLGADRRRGLFFAFLVLFLGGSTALQFVERHFFYLEFVGWWALVFAVAQAMKWPAAMRTGDVPPWTRPARLARGLAGVSAVAASIAVALLASRSYQQTLFAASIEHTLASPAGDVEVTRTARGQSERIAPTPLSAPPDEGADSTGVAAALWRLSIDPSGCDATAFDLVVRYVATDAGIDFTHTIAVPVAIGQPAIADLLVPVVRSYHVVGSDRWSRFDALEVPSEAGGCIARVREVADSAAPPILVSTILPPDWRGIRHYQTLRGLESDYDGLTWNRALYAAVRTGHVVRSTLEASIDRETTPPAFRAAALRTFEPAGAEMDSRRNPPYGYLLQSAARSMRRGRFAIAEGRLTAGAITFGILRDGAWDGQVSISRPGRFAAVVEATGDGSDSFVLGNDNNTWLTPTAFVIDRIGWTRP